MPSDAADRVATALRVLAALPPADAPFITVYLDMRAGGAGDRPALTYLRGALVRHERALGVRGQIGRAHV